MSNFVVIITDRNQVFLNVIKFNYSDVYNVFCVWHINKNVFKNCKFVFEIQKKWKKFLIVWHDVVYVHISTKYNLVWKRMRIEYENEYQEKINYLLNIWLIDHKTRFCKTWINNVFHFRILIIFRVENDHRVLKSIFKFFTDDFKTIVDRLKILLKNQYENYIIKFEQVKMSIAFNLSKELMKNLIKKISLYALQKIRKQWKHVKKTAIDSKKKKYETLKFCSKSYVIIMKLFCCHMIQKCITTSKVKLLLKNVHVHWRFKKSKFSNNENFLLDDLNEFVNDSSSRMKFRQFFSFLLDDLNEFVNDSSSRMKLR